jgi:hypothetical protein
MFIVIPDERRLEQTIASNTIKNSMTTTTTTRKQEEFKHQSHSIENLHNISLFGTLNSSMLFMPKSTINTSYINQETVVKVMQQQLLKKETLSDTISISSSSTSSPIIHARHRIGQITQQREDASSSGDSSVSSQRDSGLSSGINDESSDGSPRDSLIENEQTFIDGLIKQTERIMSMYIINYNF